MSYPSPLDDFWARILDEYRCAEVDGVGGRCQLVTGHDGEHILQRAGKLLTWPIGAQPQTRPPWATACPQDEES